MTEGYMEEISGAITADTVAAETEFRDTLSKLLTNLLKERIEKSQVPGIGTIKESELNGIVDEFMASQNAKSLLVSLENKYVIPQVAFKLTYTEIKKGFLKAMMLPSTLVPETKTEDSEVT